ncbi:MAG TPA: OmpH family outer membrane protein [Rhizomicrobium sp.]|nr:OmpH family outer membrane protein [Rhizomicrobium sp.]
MKINLGATRATTVARAFLLAAAVAATSATAAMAQQKPAPAPGGLRILVLNRDAILQGSKVGQDIIRQVNALTNQARTQFKGQEQALQNEGRALQQQVAILSAAAKKQKIAAFEAKERGLQQQVQVRQNQIQGGVFKARQQVEQALGPVLQGIMQERGAALLLDRQIVLLSTVDVDITGLAIQRLNQRLSTVKVNLVALPAPQKGKPPGK